MWSLFWQPYSQQISVISQMVKGRPNGGYTVSGSRYLSLIVMTLIIINLMMVASIISKLSLIIQF